MNKITKKTRQDIFDFIRIERVKWNGELEEADFLSRIFDLSKLPSNDPRYSHIADDIWQHRVNNPQDWDDYWIFADNRFTLADCDDSKFLLFLCTIIHPAIRRNETQVSRLVQVFNEYLSYDGYEIYESKRITDFAEFAGRQKLSTNQTINNRKQDIQNHLSGDYITSQISLMESSIEKDPTMAIGIAKELLETTCKTILFEKNITIDANIDLPKLVKATSKELRLAPEDISNEAKGSETIRKILTSLSSVVFGIAELRNDYGSGHGKHSKFKGLNARHARLAVGASSTLAMFLLETYAILEKKTK